MCFDSPSIPTAVESAVGLWFHQRFRWVPHGLLILEALKVQNELDLLPFQPFRATNRVFQVTHGDASLLPWAWMLMPHSGRLTRVAEIFARCYNGSQVKQCPLTNISLMRAMFRVFF